MTLLHVLTSLGVAVLLFGCGSLPEPSANGIHVSCLQEPDGGMCRTARPGYYYDYRSDSCKRFFQGGCGGTVPFETLDDCVQACGGKGRR